MLSCLFLTTISSQATIYSVNDLNEAYRAAVNSPLICTGILDSTEDKQGVFELPQGQSLKGIWILQRFAVDQILVGMEENKVVVVKSFMPAQNEILPTVSIPDGLIPEKQKCMLFLSKDPHGDYILTKPAFECQDVLVLPDGLPKLKIADNSTETLQHALASIIENGSKETIREALKYFLQAFPDHGKLLESLRQAGTESKDPSGYVQTLSARIRLHDETAFQESFIWLSKNSANDSAVSLITSALTHAKITFPPELCVSLLRSKDVQVRRNTAHSLKNTINSAAVPVLISALGDSDSKVRKMTLLGLREIINPQSPEFQKIKYTENNDGEIIAWWKKWWVDFGEKQFSLPTSGVVNPK